MLLLLICAAGQPVKAQDSAAIITTSYDPPRVQGALGQLVTFTISGIGRQLTATVEASSLPLPTTLAGISLGVNSETSFIPLLRIEPLGNGVAFVTGQIPFEISIEPRFHVVYVIEEGRTVATARIQVLPNNIHILRTCDSLFGQRAGACDTSLVYHLSGELVTPENPARPGENLVIYAVGLGQTERAVRSGEATPGPANVPALRVDFNFGANLLPRDIRNLNQDQLTKPAYAGLIPGLVGLYQINLQVPSLPASLPQCDELNRSNLTITLGLPPGFRTTGSFDGVGICVAP